MLYRSLRAPGWRYALLGAALSALMLAAWLGLELQRLRDSARGWPAAGPSDLLGASLSYVCHTLGPALPYLSVGLLPSALAVMAPCLLQMSIVLLMALAGVASTDTAAQRMVPWRSALAFGGGFLGTYALAALALGVAADLLADYALIWKALGGALILLLGLAVLRVLPRGALSGCHGPRWLILSGRASLRRPLGAGVAFAIYCVGCCGPYMAGLALLGIGSGSAWQGATLAGSFALLMGGLLLLPVVALPASQRLGALLMRHARAVAAISGTLLVLIGTTLALEPALAWALLRP